MMYRIKPTTATIEKMIEQSAETVSVKVHTLEDTVNLILEHKALQRNPPRHSNDFTFWQSVERPQVISWS